jgi:hypothetical protein
MISIVGLGNAASAIVENFRSTKSYNVYQLNDKVVKSSKSKFKLKSFKNPEEYEQNIPDVKKFFANLDDQVQFFVVGSSQSSNYCLGILEQIRERKIDLVYVKPDIEMLTGTPALVENAVFGILQEYARSGLLNSMTIVSNMALESHLGNLPIKTYYAKLNEYIFSAMHHINYFNHAEPEIGKVSVPAPTNRIRTICGLNVENLEEKWFFELDTPRELCYYLAINTERLEKEGGLHKKIVEMLKSKPKNAFRKMSYAIYETPYEDFGFCVAHTNVVQKNTLDKLTQVL